jgi:acetyl-CoA carboxylase biotin carboxyl carrier protein
MSFLKEYVEVFKELDLTELCVEAEGLKISMSRNKPEASCGASAKENAISCAEKSAAQSEDKAGNQEESDLAAKVKSPLLGVFDGEVNGRTFTEGDAVKKGDVLCSIEAMKMMNEVKAPVDGVISKIGAKEGDLVEYDQVLFEIA